MPQGQTKAHPKNRDSSLDAGGPDQVTAVDLRNHLDNLIPNRNHLTDAQLIQVLAALLNVVEDLTPQLGGDLDVNGKQFTGNGNFVNPLTIGSRLAVRSGDGINEVYSMDNYEPESGGVRPLLANTEDVIKVIGLTTADGFSLPDDSTNNERAEGFNIHTLTYTGLATLYIGDSVGFFQFFDLTIFGNSSATLFDIIGSALPAKQVAVIQSRFDNFDSLGVLKDIGFQSSKAAWLNNNQGITFFNCREIIYDIGPMFNFSDKNSIFITIDGDEDIVGTIKGIAVTTFSGETVFNIRPNIGEFSSISIADTKFQDGIFSKFLGDVFWQGVTGNITVIADASIASTTITSVSDSPSTPGVARFNFTGPMVHAFQKITNVGYVTNPSYNGTYIITDTDGTTYFEVSKIAWISNADGASGSFTSASILCTSIAHGLSDGEGVKVRDSVRHDGNTYLYNASADPNEFQVNIPFDTATETATWDTGSLTQEDKQITSVAGNKGLAQSRTILSISVQNNSTQTNFTGITPGDFIDMDFTSSPATLLPSTSLFKLIDPITGKSQYIGAEVDFPFTLHMPVSGEKATAVAREFLFGLQINSDAVVGFIGREFENAMGAVTIVRDMILQPGDFVTPKIANNVNQENFIVRHLQGSGR